MPLLSPAQDSLPRDQKMLHCDLVSHVDSDGLDVLSLRPIKIGSIFICRSQRMSMSLCDYGQDLRIMTPVFIL